MTTFAVAIMAHPARKARTLQLARNLLAQGIPYQIIWAKPPWATPPPSQDHRPTWTTHARALRATAKADWSIVLQDDAELLPDFALRLRRLLASGKAEVYGLHLRIGHRQLVPAGGGWWSHPDRPWIRSTGTAVIGSRVLDLADWGDKYVADRPDFRAGDDNVIEFWMAFRGLDCWVPDPPLVDHARGESLIGLGHNGRRRWRR